MGRSFHHTIGGDLQTKIGFYLVYTNGPPELPGTKKKDAFPKSSEGKRGGRGKNKKNPRPLLERANNH